MQQKNDDVSYSLAPSTIDIEQLVHDHTETLLKVAISLGFSPSDAEDIVQSTWLTFHEVQSKFEGRSSIRTFLFGIFIQQGT